MRHRAPHDDDAASLTGSQLAERRMMMMVPHSQVLSWLSAVDQNKMPRCCLKATTYAIGDKVEALSADFELAGEADSIVDPVCLLDDLFAYKTAALNGAHHVMNWRLTGALELDIGYCAVFHESFQQLLREGVVEVVGLTTTPYNVS
jgi:hypothetical protein